MYIADFLYGGAWITYSEPQENTYPCMSGKCLHVYEKVEDIKLYVGDQEDVWSKFIYSYCWEWWTKVAW